MKREIKGLLVFAFSSAVALALYGLTRPAGIPWGVETAAVFGAAAKGLAALPSAWCWVVCAVAAGLLGTVVGRYLSWRVGLAAALAYVFMPGVWNGAILGEPFALYVALGIAGLWFLNVIFLAAFMRAGATRHEERVHGQGTISDSGVGNQRRRINYIASWVILVLVLPFVYYSVRTHDYKIGEAASVYARGIVEEAGERIIVLNGVLDRQIEREVEGWRVKVEQRNDSAFHVISPTRKDEQYAIEVYDWVRKEWPNDDDLIMAARRNVQDFLVLALQRHPERFYLMNGASTTLEQWDRRWAQFVPFLDSSDRFVPTGRWLFAREANAVANKLQDTDKAAAWRLYGWIVDVVDPGNISALINMQTMASRGYDVSVEERKNIEERLAAFYRSEVNRRYVRELVQAAGPVRRDDELVAQVKATRDWFERVKTDKTAAVPSELRKMLEENNEMVQAMAANDRKKAERLARRILMNPYFQNWAPANAVMGEIMSERGDYAMSEAYFKVATESSSETPDTIWNNYANVLLKRGKLDEAEAILRQGIDRCGENFWPFQYTLAEVLTAKAKKGGNFSEKSSLREEVVALVDVVMKKAPPDMQKNIRAEQDSGEILK